MLWDWRRRLSATLTSSIFARPCLGARVWAMLAYGTTRILSTTVATLFTRSGAAAGIIAAVEVIDTGLVRRQVQ